MARRKKMKDPTELRVEQAYYRTCSGVQVNILDIPKIFAEGRRIVEAGADDALLGTKLRAFVDTIRCN